MNIHEVNPLIVLPSDLKKILLDAKNEILTNPRLALPDNPDVSILACYLIMCVTSIVMGDSFILILSLPLIDQSLLKWILTTSITYLTFTQNLKVQFSYLLCGQYFAISASDTYAVIPPHMKFICLALQHYVCILNTALYLVENN